MAQLPMNGTTGIRPQHVLVGAIVLSVLTAMLLSIWGMGVAPPDEEAPILVGETVAERSAKPTRDLPEQILAPDPRRVQITADRDAGKTEEEEGRENRAVLTGRCVAAEDGRPLAHCELYLSGLSVYSTVIGEWEGSPAFAEILPYEWGGNWMDSDLPQRELLWIRPIHLDRFFLSQAALQDLRKKGRFYQRKPNAVTDANGRFRVTFSPGTENDYLWRLFTSSPMRLPREANWLSFRSGEARELGELRLHAGLRVQGHVVDEGGQGLVGASLWIHGVPGGIASFSSKSETTRVFTQSKKDGWFAFPEPIPDGRWRLTVTGQGIASYSTWIQVQGRPLDLTLRVRERPAIRGIIRLPSGKPASDVELLAVSADKQVQGNGTSDAEGRFVIRATGTSLPSVRLVTHTLYKELLDAPHAVSWGSQGLQLRARATLPLDLLLLDQDTGEPIKGLLLVTALPAWSTEDEEVAHLVEPRQGLLKIEKIRSGRHRLWVRFNGPDHWMQKLLEIDIPRQAPRRIVMKMQRAIPFRVLVVDDRGDPVPGVRVGVSRALKPGEDIPSWYNSPDFLADGTTDGQGIAILIGAAARTPIDIRVSHDRFVPILRRAVQITKAAQEFRFVLGRGGRLQGTVLPAGGKEAQWTLRLVEKNHRTELNLDIALDGSFAKDGIPEGRYLVYLQSQSGRAKRISQVQIRPGRVERLQILDQPEAPAEVWLGLEGLPKDIGSWTPYLYTTDPLPRFDRRWDPRTGPEGTLHRVLPAGFYRLLLLPNSGPGTDTAYYHSSQPIRLEAGQKLRTRIQLLPSKSRLEILTVQGKPAAIQTFELQYQHPGNKTWVSHGVLRTDALGSVLLDQLTPWPMRLVLPGTRHATAPQIWTGQKTLSLQLSRR